MVARVALSTAKREEHNDAHDAFMTLPAYTSAREDEVRQPGRGPKPCRLAFERGNAPRLLYRFANRSIEAA